MPSCTRSRALIGGVRPRDPREQPRRDGRRGGREGADQGATVVRYFTAGQRRRLVSAMLDAALELAALGWFVFPCDWRPGDHAKAPLVRRGFLDATRDPRLIEYRWRRWPQAMIGAPVPPAQIALDVDPRHGGSRDALQPLPRTRTAWSGRNDGGCHLYFQRPLGPLTSTRVMKLGVDLRVGAKSYCILPPSIHPDSGLPYWWEPYEPLEPAVLPLHLQELLTPPPQRSKPATFTGSSAAGDALVRHVARAATGNRNKALFWAACRAGEEGILNDIQDQLLAAAISTGVSETSAKNTIKSARETTA
jgi:Bifunctional DNA primase/polymerase, N-terminal